MTYKQFWEDDPMLAKYYRKADELRTDRKNQELWLQGLYVYEAICDIAPILQMGAKRGTKAQPYPDRPYAITEKQRKREAEEREKQNALKAKRFMEALMLSHNSKFKKDTSDKKGGE